MKNLVLLHVIRMSKLFVYTFLIQCLSMSMLLAWNGNAQIKSIEEVMVNLPLTKVTINEAFDQIEIVSGFHFVYTNKETKNIPSVSLENGSKSLYAVLQSLAQQTGLGFKQV